MMYYGHVQCPKSGNMPCEPLINLCYGLVPFLLSLDHGMGMRIVLGMLILKMMDTSHSYAKHFLCRACVVVWGATHETRELGENT